MQKKKLYLIENPENETYKIGKSKNPNKRLKQLQTANGIKLNLIHCFESEFVDTIERYLHKRFLSCKIEGEWFKLNKEQVTNFETYFKKEEELCTFLSNENYFFGKY